MLHVRPSPSLLLSSRATLMERNMDRIAVSMVTVPWVLVHWWWQSLEARPRQASERT